jgi:hypothetical protein
MEMAGVGLEIWIMAFAASAAFLVWGLKRYQIVAADGKVTLDEIIDTLTGAEKPLDEMVDAVEKLEAALEAAKQAKLEAEAAEAAAQAVVPENLE